jgi:hypothetical protein
MPVQGGSERLTLAPESVVSLRIRRRASIGRQLLGATKFRQGDVME